MMKAEEPRDKRRKKNEQSHREMWDTIKCVNICVTGVVEEEKRKTNRKNI